MRHIERYGSPEEAEEGVMRMLADGESVMGFGHPVYTDSDPRSDIIKGWSKRLSEKSGDAIFYDVSERIEEVMRREKNMFPNADFFSASTTSRP